MILRSPGWAGVMCAACLAACGSAVEQDGGRYETGNMQDTTTSEEGLDAPQPVDVLDATLGDDAVDRDADAIDAIDAIAIDTQFDISIPETFILDGSVVCNTTVNDAPLISITTRPGSPPAPRGGAITPGHYQLTAYEFYAPVAPYSTIQESVDVTSSALFSASVRDGTPEVRFTDTYVLNGTTLSFTVLCPAGGAGPPEGYSATPTQLTLTDGIGTGANVRTYTLH